MAKDVTCVVEVVEEGKVPLAEVKYVGGIQIMAI